ncbi:ComEA family DNA-binding protein [Eionea flava]
MFLSISHSFFSRCALLAGLLIALSFSTTVTADTTDISQQPPSQDISEINDVADQMTKPHININADSAEIIADGLKGIGLKKAQAIVAWREANGAFTSKEQLMEVKGIGEKIWIMNESKLGL